MIGNLLIRMYGRIWDERLRKEINTFERQKGFVPVDGCFENVNILKSISSNQRKRKKAYQIVFPDLAKAFDTATHDSIKKAQYRKVVPVEVIEGIMGMYRQATTVTGVGGKFARRIKINAGVKQGCQLSQFLFNVVIDKLLGKIEQKKIGIKVGDALINIMAFADDLVLITEEPGDMKILLQMCKKFFDEKGLSVNATKCASLKVLPVKGKRALKVITEIYRHWKGQPIPSINFEKLGKF